MEPFDVAGAIPDEVPEAVRVATSKVAEGFMRACIDDPLFEFGLLVMTFMPLESTWRDGEPWGARHWRGTGERVKSADVPRGLELGQFADARPAGVEWNAAWWLVGLKPDQSGVVMRVLTEYVTDPMQALEDGNWAVARIADLDRDLASRNS